MLETPNNSPSVVPASNNLNGSEEWTSSEIMTLVLKDDSNLEQAIYLLKSSENLYDQIDLLHCMFILDMPIYES